MDDIQIDRIEVLEQEEIDLQDSIRTRISRKHSVDSTLSYETVSALVVPEGTDKARYDEVVIHANLKRPNLQWYEIVELERRLHEMRQDVKGVAKSGKKVGWSLRDTANELEMGLGTLSQDLRLAEACIADPTLRNVKDKMTAQRLIMNKARRIEAEAEASAPIRIEYNSVLLGDSAEILKHFPDSTFDVCFTDPPWLEYKDQKLTKDDSTIKVFDQVSRVLKRGSFLYMIVSTPDFIWYQKELPKFGFSVQQMPLIWHKLNTISHGLRPWEYGRDYEPILLAVKGNPVLANASQMSSVYTSAAVNPAKLIHPNEKPVDVPLHFLQHCTYDGSLVLDPFGGSGVTAEACKKLGRRYVIIERDKRYFDGIERRLSQGVVDGQGSGS